MPPEFNDEGNFGQEFDDEGNFGRQYTHEDVREAFETVDEVVILTSDVANELGCSNETVRRRLNDLYDDGLVNKRTFGRQTVWWQLPPDTAEERPGRQLKRISQEIKEPIVVGDIVYEDGQTRLLTDAQTEYVERLSEEEVVETVDEAVVLTSDIAEELGCSNETARRRLNDLYDNGGVNKRTFGQQTVWWQIPPETAEERPGRRLRQISQGINEPIIVGDIVYKDGQTRLLTDAQTEYVERLSEEEDEPIVGESVSEDGDIDLLASVQKVASAIEEMRREAESPTETVIAAEEKEAVYQAALKRLAASDQLDERAVLDAINADNPPVSFDKEEGVDAATLVERLPAESYEAILREHFDELADNEELTMEALSAALDRR